VAPVRRWLDAFVALPERLKLPVAILLALLAHLLLFVTIWIAPIVAVFLHLDVLLRPFNTTASVAPPPEPKLSDRLRAATPKPLELSKVEILPPTAPVQPPPPAAPLTAAELAQLQKLFEALPEEEQQQYIDVEGLARAKNLSKRALFESWRDSVAGSKKPGQGTDGLPSQDGRSDLTFTDFKNQEANNTPPKRFDEEGGPAPMPSVKFPGLEAPPIYRPRPVEKKELATNAKPSSPPATAASTPPPAAASEPARPSEPAPPVPEKRNEPMRMVKLLENEVPLLKLDFSASRLMPKMPAVPLKPVPDEPKPTPAPAPVAKTPPQPTPAPAPVPTPVPMVAKTTPPKPTPVPEKDPASALHKEQRKIEGSGPAGENGVDAIATERGKYKRMMNLIVNSRWEPAVKSHQDMIAVGTVSIRFAIDSTGRLVKFKVDRNTSNNAHAMLVEQAIRATRFQPPPPELLRNGVFEDEFNFTIY
jgi:outer membrane biosynthesis protein TonB